MLSSWLMSRWWRYAASESPRRFKLDENLPVELAALCRGAGHSAATVLEQHLGGARDAELASVCARKNWAIVTLDMGFSDIRTYTPAAYAGVVVFRLQNQSRDHVVQIARRFIAELSEATPEGQLWIVDESRIRIRQ